MKDCVKIYIFEHDGHHYDYMSNSKDFKSCPFCGSTQSKKIGECEKGDWLTFCFECQNCFEKFYYHESIIFDNVKPCKLTAPINGIMNQKKED